MNAGPSFPPLMQGLHAAGADPFDAAFEAAQAGADPGTIVYDIAPDALRAAIVLGPDVVCAKAAVMLPLTAIAVQNALGALGPSEMPVHLDWDGAIRVNGALCGAVRAAADTNDPGIEPGWMVTGFTLIFDRPGGEGGETPDLTCLRAEGCGDLDPQQLLESWSRHLLNWINRWEDDGIAPVHRDYAGLVHGMGEDITVLGQSGHFLGLDENLGMLLKSNGTTRLVPLTDLLEIRP